jgi:hypothetical protein
MIRRAQHPQTIRQRPFSEFELWHSRLCEAGRLRN